MLLAKWVTIVKREARSSEERQHYSRFDRGIHRLAATYFHRMKSIIPLLDLSNSETAIVHLQCSYLPFPLNDTLVSARLYHTQLASDALYVFTVFLYPVLWEHGLYFWRFRIIIATRCAKCRQRTKR